MLNEDTLTLSASNKFPDLDVRTAADLRRARRVDLQVDTLREGDPLLVPKYVINNFYGAGGPIPSDLESYVGKRFKVHCDSPQGDQRDKAEQLYYAANYHMSLGSIDREYVHSLVVESMQDAFKDQQKKLDKTKDRWSKKRVACCASLASVLSSAATVVIALIASKPNKCD